MGSIQSVETNRHHSSKPLGSTDIIILPSSSSVTVCVAGGPLPPAVIASTVQLYVAAGVKPSRSYSPSSGNVSIIDGRLVTSSSSGRQERLYEVMIPLRASDGGGSHETVTLSGLVATTLKFVGGLPGPVERKHSIVKI